MCTLCDRKSVARMQTARERRVQKSTVQHVVVWALSSYRNAKPIAHYHFTFHFSLYFSASMFVSGMVV